MTNYFSENETKGLDPHLVEKLNIMREAAGIPVVITCGVRTPEENAKLNGSAPDSAHLYGLAADIRCPDSNARYHLLQGAFSAGFRRIEVGTAHIHVDIDVSKPQEVCWLGVSA